jgi:hypothetical protein
MTNKIKNEQPAHSFHSQQIAFSFILFTPFQPQYSGRKRERDRDRKRE